MGHPWGGLGRSSRSESLICDTPTGHWFMAIGAKSYFRGGIPGPLNEEPVKKVELYIKRTWSGRTTNDSTNFDFDWFDFDWFDDENNMKINYWIKIYPKKPPLLFNQIISYQASHIGFKLLCIKYCLPTAQQHCLANMITPSVYSAMSCLCYQYLDPRAEGHIINCDEVS